MLPSVLWPFPWWTSAMVAVLLIAIPWWVAWLRVRQRNRRLQQLGAKLSQSGISIGPDLFAIGEEKVVLVVSGNRLAVADLKSWRVAQMLSWAQARTLKIYDNSSNLIEFRLVLNGGAQTRKIRTYSIAGFGRLFVKSAKESKSVQYIPR